MLTLPMYWLFPVMSGLFATSLSGHAQASVPASKLVAAVAPSANFTFAPNDSARRTALHYEAELLKRGVARRRPAEADTAFLKRLFPTSFYTNQVVLYSWRPSAFGKQLFFSCREQDAFGQNGEGTQLFVLDPFQTNTYAVQMLLLEPIGDITNLASFFFADVDRDGQKELLALVYAEVQHVDIHTDGRRLVGRVSEWQTQVFRYTGLSRTGRPHYQRDRKSRPYLNHLCTAAAVRQALIKHTERLK